MERTAQKVGMISSATAAVGMAMVGIALIVDEAIFVEPDDAFVALVAFVAVVLNVTAFFIYRFD